MSYSLHYRNSQSNPYYSGVTVPYPGYLHGSGNTEPAEPLTVEDIDAYFATSLNGAAWNALTPEVKAAALAEAQRWLSTLCWNMEDCCGRDFEAAYLMATAELALALATVPNAVISGQPSDGRWVQRERLDVLEQEYGLLESPGGGISAPGSGYPVLLQRFPWLKDIIGCWLQVGPQRQIRLYRN